MGCFLLSCFILSLRQPLCLLILVVELSRWLHFLGGLGPGQSSASRTETQDFCFFFLLLPCPSHSESSHVSYVVLLPFPQLLKILLLKEESSRPGIRPFSRQCLLFSPRFHSVLRVFASRLWGQGRKACKWLWTFLVSLVARVLSSPVGSLLIFRNSQTF